MKGVDTVAPLGQLGRFTTAWWWCAEIPRSTDDTKRLAPVNPRLWRLTTWSTTPAETERNTREKRWAAPRGAPAASSTEASTTDHELVAVLMVNALPTKGVHV